MYRQELELVMEAFGHWQRMRMFRQERARCKRYCYGDQWGDSVLVDGHRMREEHYIRSQGSEPLKNNLIRRLVRCWASTVRRALRGRWVAAVLPRM